MPKVTFISSDNQEYPLEVDSGTSAMEAAINNLVPGIDADCGGAAACGTCHVYVDASFAEKIDEGSEMEQQMLSLTDNVADNSRLACQITIDDKLNGLILRIPENQH